MTHPKILRTGTAVLVAAGLAVGIANTSQASTSHAKSEAAYTIKVSNSGAGGDPGYFYKGGPLNITVKKTSGKSSAKITVTLSPQAIDRSNPIHSRVGKTITGLAPSKVGTTKITVKISGTSTVLHKSIKVRTAK